MLLYVLHSLVFDVMTDRNRKWSKPCIAKITFYLCTQ